MVLVLGVLGASFVYVGDRVVFRNSCVYLFS